MTLDDATRRQVDAARPGFSTWLSANAGSGKTRVLTDRVARLLLDGVDPSHILCLTYTKAAATEMQNRLFKRLGGWAMLDVGDLRAELALLGVERDLDAEFLAMARTLFARAIETPGGLRIQTIHSFCAALLRRFPLEAGVSPQFQEMEDRAAELMRGEILDRMADGPQAHLVQGIAPFMAGDETDKLLARIAGLGEAFDPAITAAHIRAAYGLAPGDSEETLLASVFLGGEADFLSEMVPALRSSGANDKKLADAIESLTGPSLASLEILEGVLLTGPGAKEPFTAKIGSLPTKGLLKKQPMDHLLPRLEDLMRRVEAARDTRCALECASRDTALHAFARAFLPAYAAEKERRGWLDFDDLITRARHLLSDPKVADWVLYRLDGGIDHILVDEAQDTSPVQWQVIERLAREFTSGEGARADTRRTIFVVGDKKQSIYSFQGADPTEFDRMADEFRERLKSTEAPLVRTELEYSFRSADPILRLVDNTFRDAAPSGFDGALHRAFKDRMPGRVDLWPAVEKIKEEAPGPWFEPVDRQSQTHHTVLLARRIARQVRQLIDARTPVPEEIGHSGTYSARPVHAGDFLILVRSRGRLFKEIIRACKQEGVPVAGADRLKVMAELAVRDIIACLSFLSTPEDDLSLATLLRSPLFGWSEQQLFTLAAGRERKYLWEALRETADDHPQVMAVLDDLRKQTDFLRPYDLIERLLTRHRGRRLLIGRLGPEAEDGINALLQQALAYEQSAVPSLTGFLEWAQADELQIKRAPDSGGAVLRVMTVHGAKGLEAPIVILPDCGAPDTKLREEILTDASGALWKAPADAQPPRQRLAVEEAKEKEARERDRLLYVAMTRAEKWLIVAAAGELGKDGASWHEKVRRGMDASGAVTATFDFGDLGRVEGWQIGDADWSGLTLEEPPQRQSVTPELPDHLSRPAPPPVVATPTRSPSDLGGAKALPGADGDTEARAKARGTILHMFLEYLSPLPPDARAAAGEALARSVADPEFDAAGIAALRDEALAVLSAPDLAHVFAPGTLAEVPITADLGPPGRIHGVIDRLIVTAGTVTAIDFKSNRTVPATPEATPEGLLRQMGAYHAALAQLYPGRRIETALVWTATAHYMSLPHDLVTQALARIPAP